MKVSFSDIDATFEMAYVTDEIPTLEEVVDRALTTKEQHALQICHFPIRKNDDGDIIITDKAKSIYAMSHKFEDEPEELANSYMHYFITQLPNNSIAVAEVELGHKNEFIQNWIWVIRKNSNAYNIAHELLNDA